MNRGTVPERIEGVGRLGVSILCGAIALAACSGSSNPPPPETSVPPAAVRIEPTIAPTAVPPAPTATQEPQPASPAPPEAPAAATQTATAQPAAVQPIVPTARIPAPAPPPPPTAVPEAPSRPPPVTVAMTLNLAERSFTPHQVHGNAGDTVALTFTGGTEQHTFTVSSLGIDVSLASRETKQFSFVMPVDGEVPFFCRLHGTPSSGMHGLLIFH